MSKAPKDPVIKPWLVRTKERVVQRLLVLISHPLNVVKTTFIVTGALVWLCLLLLGLYFYTVISKVPDLDGVDFQSLRELGVDSVVSKIDSREKRRAYHWVRLDDINRDLLYAIVMSEDGEFFSHTGVNWDALINAMAENLKKREFSYGASTISQQVSKNVFLRSSTKTFHRKLTELFVTWEVERELSKNEILELYLNVAEFGPDIYGVSHAADYYFGKKTSDINAAEGAFLAIMLPSPRKYHYSVFQNQNLSARHKRKLKRILADMVYKEYISPSQYRRYLNWNYFAGR